MKNKFFSLAELKQPVNQWLCIAFLGVFCFWTVLYYFTSRAEAVGKTFNVADAATYIVTE